MGCIEQHIELLILSRFGYLALGAAKGKRKEKGRGKRERKIRKGKGTGLLFATY